MSTNKSVVVLLPDGMAEHPASRTLDLRRMATSLPVQISDLGPPLDIKGVADLLGYSTWTVRRSLIPRGLPHFRVSSGGRMLFYRDQVIRWLEAAQKRSTRILDPVSPCTGKARSKT